VMLLRLFLSDELHPWRSFSDTHANVELPLVAPAELEA
jgi:hypothetical protein